MLEQFIIFCAKYVVVAPVGAVLAYAHREGLAVAKRMGLELVLALPLAYILCRVAGLFIYNEQPFVLYGFEPLLPHAIDNSFPSDHVAFAAVFATVAYLRHRYVGLSAWFFVGVVGVARVAAGVHHPHDIVAAALLAVAAVFIARAALTKLRVAYPKLG